MMGIKVRVETKDNWVRLFEYLTENNYKLGTLTEDDYCPFVFINIDNSVLVSISEDDFLTSDYHEAKIVIALSLED
jgi:hypothetical protein